MPSFARSLVSALVVAVGAVAQGPAGPRVRVVEDVPYAEGFANEPRRNRLDLYVPDGVSRPPLVMFVHGGAWTGGGKEFGAPLAHAFARAGIACACINTQLFPFARPAAMVDDCARALGWLHRHAGAHGVDGERLFVMGHSSGAHLVAWLACDEKHLAAAGVPRTALRGVVALSGVYELRCRHPVLDRVFGDDLDARAAGSPCQHAGPGDPPFLLLWGQHDLPGLALCARMLRDRLQAAGVPVDARELAGGDHVGYVLRLPQPGDAEFARIAAFVHGSAAPPPAAAAPATPARAVLPAAAGVPELVVHRPVGSWPRAVVLWLAGSDAERADGERVAAGLAPHGVATVLAPAPADAAGVAVLWRRLRPAGTDARLVPQWLGAGGTAIARVLAAPLDGSHGLRGRVALGTAALPDGATPATLAGRLAAAGAAGPGVLLLFGQHDAAPATKPLVDLGILLAQRGVGVHLVELPGASTAQAVAGAGAAGDLVLPLLRAFVLP